MEQVDATEASVDIDQADTGLALVDVDVEEANEADDSMQFEQGDAHDSLMEMDHADDEQLNAHDTEVDTGTLVPCLSTLCLQCLTKFLSSSNS
jgi:hypothetical protein